MMQRLVSRHKHRAKPDRPDRAKLVDAEVLKIPAEVDARSTRAAFISPGNNSARSETTPPAALMRSVTACGMPLRSTSRSMKAGASGMNSRKSRDRAIVPSGAEGADLKRLTVVTGTDSATPNTSRPRLTASFGAILSIRSASAWAPAGKGMRFASPDDIRHALPSETGDPSTAAAILFDRTPADFFKTVISMASGFMGPIPPRSGKATGAA